MMMLHGHHHSLAHTLALLRDHAATADSRQNLHMSAENGGQRGGRYCRSTSGIRDVSPAPVAESIESCDSSRLAVAGIRVVCGHSQPAASQTCERRELWGLPRGCRQSRMPTPSLLGKRRRLRQLPCGCRRGPRELGKSSDGFRKLTAGIRESSHATAAAGSSRSSMLSRAMAAEGCDVSCVAASRSLVSSDEADAERREGSRTPAAESSED